jgi:hypothetical protein
LQYHGKNEQAVDRAGFFPGSVGRVGHRDPNPTGFSQRRFEGRLSERQAGGSIASTCRSIRTQYARAGSTANEQATTSLVSTANRKSEKRGDVTSASTYPGRGSASANQPQWTVWHWRSEWFRLTKWTRRTSLEIT